VQRRAVAPTFTREHAHDFAEYIHASTRDWAASVQRGDDLASAINELGSSHVLRSGYGLDPNDELARAFARAGAQRQRVEGDLGRDRRCQRLQRRGPPADADGAD
jgi:hypothetical protein